MASDEAASRLLSAEELRIGEEFRTSDYVFSPQSIRDFAAAWDPMWFHLDEERAVAGPFGGIIASGLQSLAVLQRLLVLEVYSRWQVVVGRGFREVRFLQPVRPQDRTHATLRVLGIDPRHPERSLVTARAELVGARGALVSLVV